jgi:hypothetical protein
MNTHRFIFPATCSLAAVLLILNACGAPSPTSSLVSVTVSPTAATAPSPGGQVQFVATGHYNVEPYTVSPLQAIWGANLTQKIATITQDGLATCVQGASGTTTVEAWVELPNEGAVCDVVDAQGRMICGSVGGTAQLTCP